jgi:phosphoserine phosphatase
MASTVRKTGQTEHHRLRLPRLRPGTAVALALLVDTACQQRSPDLTQPPKNELSQVVGRLQRGRLPADKPPLLKDLDATGDGKLDAADWKVFEQVAAAASGALGKRAVSIALPGSPYDGPPEAKPSVFSHVVATEGELDVSRTPPERLAELAIESRWLAAQAKLAAHGASGVLDGLGLSGLLSSAVVGYNAEAMTPAAVCAAIDQLDTTAFVRSGLQPTAIFDLDSTVWRGDVSDAFLGLLAERGIPRSEANPGLQAFLKTLPGVDPGEVDARAVSDNVKLLFHRRTAADVPEDHRVSAKDGFFQLVAMLKGLPEATVHDAARAVFEEGSSKYPPWRDQVFADQNGCGMRQVLQRLAARGVHVHFLSATLDVLAHHGADLLGVPRTRVLGSVLEVVNGHYTGKVVKSTYHTKGPLTRQLLSAPPLLAFGDSPRSDVPMLLEAVGAAFMVNPRPSLLERDRTDAGGRFVKLVFDVTEGQMTARGGR